MIEIGQNQQMVMQVIVIGGGAAGFFGAIACRETSPHTHVTLLEAGATPLSKVRISGGGRCNVTHACFDPAHLVQHYPRGGRALRGAFSRFQPKDTVAWFQQRGIALKTEADGRMFPTTDDSATIVNGLMESAHQQGVELRTKAMVADVRRRDQGFEVSLKSGERVVGDRLLLATGSNPKGYAIARHLGHIINPPVPSLFTFNITDPHLHDLAGISVESVHAQLHCDGQKPLKQEGPLLITHWGMSGPAILKLSAWGARMLHDCHYRATLRIHWCPGFTADQVRSTLMAFKQENPKRAIATASPFSLSRRLWGYLVRKAEITEGEGDRWAHLSKKNLNRLVQEITQSEFAIVSKGVFKDEFVTCGGVNLKEVNFKTMESRLCPGLFFAGEILDIDGVTGGFNFQSAWTTGWIAGQAIGQQP